MSNEEEELRDDAEDHYPELARGRPIRPRCTSGMCGCLDCPVCYPSSKHYEYNEEEIEEMYPTDGGSNTE